MSDPVGADRACPRCGRSNGAEATNCIRCGLDLTVSYDHPSEPEAPTLFCYKHPKAATNLSCGRCERPICTKCAVIGPSGIRCKECARQKIAVRPGAVAYEVKRSVFQVLFSGPWSLWITITVAGFLFWTVRSCMSQVGEARRSPPVERPASEEV
jgi:hypothetical protein